MVRELKSLNDTELQRVVEAYPWYAAARKEQCGRLAAAGALSDHDLCLAALCMASRRLLSGLVVSPEPFVQAEFKGSQAVPEEQAASVGQAASGGDYFSSEQYKSFSREEDNIFASFVKSEKAVPDSFDESEPAFEQATETLAGIYAAQGYVKEAKQIYYKLSLRYPEKSVYFASLIEKLEEK